MKQKPKTRVSKSSSRSKLADSDIPNAPSSALRLDLLVVGYGNTLRNDDGVGPRVAEAIEALRLPGVETMACPLLTPELAEPIARARRVIFVDATIEAPGEVQLRKLSPAPTSQVMAHAANPQTMLAIARDVFGHAPEAWCLSIPVADLGIGETFSTLARRGVEAAVERICGVAGRIHHGAQ